METEGHYLGITLTPKPEDLISANYTPFLNTLGAQIELSGMGRLAAFKMHILPQLLYIFRTLPIPLPESYFNSQQQILNKYLWQCRKARFSFGKLIKHKKVGEWSRALARLLQGTFD